MGRAKTTSDVLVERLIDRADPLVHNDSQIMPNTTPFPTEPGELTAEWLTRTLRATEAIGSSTVTGFSWALVAEQGAAGTVGRASLEYDRAELDAPPSVVLKFATPHAPIRTIMHRFGLYRAEVEFYRQLSAYAGIPTPRCYFADIDTDSGYFVLVMEDMKDSRLGDPLHPAVSDVEVAIDHIAAFHARWWKHPRLRKLDWLFYPDGPAFEARAAGLKMAFSGAVGTVRQRLGAQFPHVLSEACARILAGWPAFMASRTPAAPTLVHRDFHLQQLFFPSARGGRFAVYDWQTLTIGCGADDVGRIIAMGLRSADRAAHEQRLIERYYTGLLQHGVPAYSAAQCQLDVRLGLTGSLFTNVVAAAAIDLSLAAQWEADTGVTLTYAIFDRLAKAFEAHEVLSLLPASV